VEATVERGGEGDDEPVGGDVFEGEEASEQEAAGEGEAEGVEGWGVEEAGELDCCGGGAYASLVAVSNESNFRCACGFTLAPFDFAQGRLAAAWKGVCGWRLWHPFGCAQDRLRTVPFRGCGLCRWMLGVGELQIPAE